MNPDTPLQLLGGISAREFMRDYWQKKPLLVRQAFPDFISPIDPDELAGLALEEEVESRIVLEHGAHPWELRRGPFNEDTFAELPEKDWTCWYKRWTSSSRKWPNCWKTSASCPAGVSTM